MSNKLFIENDEIVYDGKFLQTIKRNFRNIQTQEQGVWETVKRKTHGRIVAIVAVTKEKEVILTKIYRIPIKSWIIEICAGLMDKPGESEEEVARRELLEETGYRAERLEKLMEGYFNAGLLADEMVVWFATNAIKVQEPDLEPSEEIEVLKIPLDKLAEFLQDPPDGVKIDMKLFGVLYFLKERYGK